MITGQESAQELIPSWTGIPQLRIAQEEVSSQVP
jgi:hypothetical protein